MNDSDEHSHTLIELGLSPSQARVYLTLVKSKNLTAGVIHNNCGIVRPDIYRVLGELEKAGLVEKIISKPQIYRAIPIEECVSTLLQRRINKTLQLQKETLKLTQCLGGKTESEESKEKFEFILITGKDAVQTKTEKMIKNAQQSIYLLGMTRRMLSWLSNCVPTLEESLARNVDLKIIIPKPEKGFWELLITLGKHPNFSLRLISEQPSISFSVWDQKEIQITTSGIDSSTPAPSLWSNNKCVVDLCREHFEYLWEKAEKTNFNI